jgi:hypothetical protein
MNTYSYLFLVKQKLLHYVLNIWKHNLKPIPQLNNFNGHMSIVKEIITIRIM